MMISGVPSPSMSPTQGVALTPVNVFRNTFRVAGFESVSLKSLPFGSRM